ncbi:acyl-CoA thioesterase [Halalkalibacillus sediminis]|nr:thioesterase family protein [Halalkalibacillus sediminis]
MNIAYIEDFQTWQQEFSFYIPVNVRFSETDMFGHVNNVSPFIYFEEARIAYMNEVDLFGPMSQETKKVPVVADLQCNYLKQMYFGDQLKMYVKTDNVGKSSLDIHYMALNQKEELCIVGRGRVVQIDSQTGTPTPFDDVQRKKLGVNE